MRTTIAAVAAVLLALLGLTGPARPAGAATAETDPVWRITEATVQVTAAPGLVSTFRALCPGGQEVIGGDIRDFSDFRYEVVKAALPDWGNQSFVGTVAIDPNHGQQSFTVVAYCVPSALVSGTSVQQVFFNPPGGAFGKGPAGGSAACASGQRVIGGGARLWDTTTPGHLFSSSPHLTGDGWYGSASLDGSAILVEALCLPASQVPPPTLASRTVDNTIGAYAYFVGSPSAHCPEGTRVLAGGGYTAINGQFPNPADPSQGRVAQSHSETGYWYATIGMNDGYESTTVVWCIPDADPPTVAMTSPAASPFSARVSFSPAVAVGWTGSDAADYVARYQTRWRSAPYNGTFGAWQTPASWSDLTGVTVTHGSRPVGATYCYSTRGQDPAGNWSAWAAQRCAIRPLDDRSLAVSSGWTRGSASQHWNGTFTSTTVQGAKLTLSGARFNQLGLVAKKCPTCGRVAIAVNGTQIGTVNLASATTSYRNVVALSRTPGRVGTITITVLTSGKEVAIDGLAVSAS